MKNEFRQYIFAGVPFILIGLLINPWLISWTFKADYPTTIFAGILVISIVLIMIGWGIMYKKNKFISWIFQKYNEIAVIILNLIILFGIINFIAAVILYKPVKQSSNDDYFYSPYDITNDSIDFMRKIYPGKSDEEIKDLVDLRNPYENHPVLEYQEKVQRSNCYNVGVEGIRFDNKVTREHATELINGAVWVFGGSTTFGQGVKDNETISAELNKQDSSKVYINFGVHAYHQSNEIEKLLLLLKKGYTPSKVIFIDGLNDVIRMIETNFNPLETPALAKSAYTSDYNIASKPTGSSALKQLPATRLFRSLLGKEKGPDVDLLLPWNKYDDVYDPDNLYNTNPSQHYQSTKLRSPYKQIDTSGLSYIVWKLSTFYKANYAFLEKISKAYGFEFSIYYQPIGVLSNKNPFWKDQNTYKQTPLYTNFNYIVPRIRSTLNKWKLPNIYDISDVQDSCADCYVDLTHYNPQLNRLIASAILNNEKKKQ